MSENYMPNFDILNTKFVYATNFSGDPEKNQSGRSQRLCNVMLTDMDMVNELKENGIYVKAKPADERYGETALDSEGNCYFVKAHISFNGASKPMVKLQTAFFGQTTTQTLDEDTIGMLDRLRIKKVSLTLSPSWYEQRQCWVLWIRGMKVWAEERNSYGYMDDTDDDLTENMPF